MTKRQNEKTMNNKNIYSLEVKIHNLSNEPWILGNSVLYKLCQEHPQHKTDAEIIAKIWLIGRAYAASIERRKNKLNINDDFYTKVVSTTIMHSEIDKWLNECKDIRTKETCIEVYKKVTNLFKKISGLEKRSLASKYLHFHLPKLFFIYDSRTAHAINKLLRELKIKKTRIETDYENTDKAYASFYTKCLVVQSEIQKQYGIVVDPRQLDTLLIDIGNSNLRI